ncbi:MAG: hypothetical protein ACREC5_03840, partial [Thermoplasmata archaeon]
MIVAYAGEPIQLNLTAAGATQSVLIPFRAQPVVDVQVVPGLISHALFTAPATPGGYGVPDGEYDGPWFGQDVAALVVLPPSGGTVPTLSAFQAGSGAGDLYDPPVRSAASAALVGDDEGIFNGSVPGPTLASAAPVDGGPVSFDWTVPLASVGAGSHLVNVTSNDPAAQQQHVEEHDDTLPDPFGIYAIDPVRGLVPITSAPLRIGSTVTESA